MNWGYIWLQIKILILSFPVAAVSLFFIFKRMPTLEHTILAGLITFFIIIIITSQEMGQEYVDRLINRKEEKS